MLQSKLKLVGDIGSLSLALGSGGSISTLTLLLGSSGLGTVFIQHLEDVGSLILSNALGELVDGGRDLKTLVKHGTLTLDAHILGPTDETGEITSSGTDGTSDVEGTGLGGEERVGLGRGLGDGLSLGLGGFLGRHGC